MNRNIKDDTKIPETSSHTEIEHVLNWYVSGVSDHFLGIVGLLDVVG